MVGNCKYVNLCVKTVRRAVKALIKANWINAHQDNQLAPIHFELDHPHAAYLRNHIFQMQSRIDVAPYYGEAICKEIIVFLVNPNENSINFKPSWLFNSILECIWKFIYSIQGEQHFNATSFSSQEEVNKPKVRDAIKKKLLADRNIKLIAIKDNELRVDIIAQKLKGIAPLRNLDGSISRRFSKPSWSSTSASDSRIPS